MGNQSTPSRPYATGVGMYAAQGYDGIISIQRDSKAPVIKGVTGREGRQLEASVSVRRASQHGNFNIALRLSKEIVGIDIDAHSGKQGAATLAGLEAKYGRLPKTFYSTSRGAGTSGIRFYRLNKPGELMTEIKGDIEIIQFHHRFAMVWPSIHPTTGEVYQTYEGRGEAGDQPLDFMPRPQDLPLLPEAWEAFLRGGKPKRKKTPTGPLPSRVGTLPGLLAHIRAEAAVIAALPPGSHANGPVNTAVLKLSSYAPHDVEADTIRTEFRAAVETWEDGHEEGYAAIESGLSVIGTPKHEPKPWIDSTGAGFTLSGSTAGGQGWCPDASDPMEVARHIADEFQQDGYPTILFRGQTQYYYSGTYWEEVDKRAVEVRLHQRMDKELCLKQVGDEMKPVRWAPTPTKIGALYAAVMSINFVREDEIQPGAWRGKHDQEAIYIPMANGILVVKNGERRLIRSTPRLFNLTASTVKYNPRAKCNTWLSFLDSVFPDDLDSIRAVQQFMGYLISGRTDLEKSLSLIGPTRSGKGTIADAIAAILGESAVTSLRLSDLSKDFGMEKLVGKSVALVPDNKAKAIRADKMQAVVENLLSISANDRIVVNRKNQKELSLKLGTRVVLMSNDIQQFSDGSNAITERFIVIKMSKSFLGREDNTLKRRIEAEAAGIFNWALDGLDDLNESGSLHQPKSGLEYKDLMQSETMEAEFVRRRLEIGGGYHMTLDHLWTMWVRWSEEHQMKPGNKNHLPGKIGTIITAMGGSLMKRQLTAKEDPARPTVWEGARISESYINGIQESN